jgi:hypothetical protein
MWGLVFVMVRGPETGEDPSPHRVVVQPVSAQ